MVRVFLKGGVWKNSEDEILKAAVQKYGKQQWARVASLLNRKTAKQAKARWHEWLDPSIRKTEWSRQEEEKLLHLAKLMPAQWKTIAPLVGRTATQCQEHYEQLLDQAATASASSGQEGAAAAAADSGEQALRNAALRPGQIDAHPETRPARPDPIDMDEDEMEMLQEARARLANTVGKKAKRKQREKMLAQAKRLADLQKRRELKQAGLLSKQAKKAVKAKARREIDLGVEIPFHKPAPAGFHDVGAEDARAESVRQKRLKQVDYQKVNESQYRTRDREAAAAKRREEARLRILEQSNEKYAKHAASQKEDEEKNMLVRPRGTLSLPAPMVTDTELAQLAKIQQQQLNDAAAVPGGDEGPAATQALLGDYSDRPLPTPMRTPASTSAADSMSTKKESLMKSAQRLRQLERGTTPLLVGGQEQADGDDEDQNNEIDDGDRKPAAIAMSTAQGQTPMLPDREGAGKTPRDELGLNRPPTELLGGAANDDAAVVGGVYGAGADDAASVGARTFDTTKYSIRELARQERRAAKRARLELEKALAALPAPQFEYELAAPATAITDDDDDHDTNQRTSLEDADRADIEARELEQQRAMAEKLYEARSSVLKRTDLPRPAKVNDTLSLYGSANSEGGQVAAMRMVEEEMLTLLRHDAAAFPISTTYGMDNGKKKKKKKRKQNDMSMEENQVVALDFIPEHELDAAEVTVQAELEVMMNGKMAAVQNSTARVDAHDAALTLLTKANEKASMEGGKEMVYGLEGWVQRTTDNGEESVAALRLEFDTIQEATDALRKKNDKLEAKLGVVNGGYVKRSQKLRDDILQTFTDLQNAQIEESVYRMLKSHEVQGATNRINRLREDIDLLKKGESLLQQQYGELVVEKRRLAVQANKTAAPS